MPTFISRLLDLVLRRQREDRLSEEIQAHLDLLADDYVAQGMSPADARLAARKAFGGVDQVKERYRDQRGLPMIDALTQDARYGIRMLGKEPLLTAAAVLALGIGIGATNTVFTMVNAFLLRDLPVKDGHELVAFGTRNIESSRPGGVSVQEFREWQAELTSVKDLLAYRSRPATLRGDGVTPDQIWLYHLSERSFEILGLSPQLGRVFTAEDERAGAPPTVVISHALWQRRYGGDPAILGRSALIGDIAATVIGVMPPGESFPAIAEAWQPLTLLPGVDTQPRSTRNLSVLGRLVPGATLAMARTEMAMVGDRDATLHPEANKTIRPSVVTTAEYSNGGWWQIFPALILVAALVLLVTCANTATLLLARAASRSREIALRVSLGATRGRIVCQLMIESLALAVTAGCVAYLVSIAGIRFVDYTMRNVTVRPQWTVLTMDPPVLLFLGGLCLVTPILFGLLPAWHLSRTNGSEMLKEGGRNTTSRRAFRWTSGLVVAEIALSLVVLVCTGILINTMWSLRAADRVFDIDHLVTATLTLPASYRTADQRLSFVNRLGERLRANPAIAGASLASLMPLSGMSPLRRLGLPNAPVASTPGGPDIGVISVGAGYFQSLGISVLHGRDFADSDVAGSPVAIVNRRFAEVHFPNTDPLGQQIQAVEIGKEQDAVWLTIVGISPSVRQAIVTEAPPVVYVPYRGEALPRLDLIVRAAGISAALAPTLREELKAIDDSIPLVSPQTSEEMMSVRLFTHNLTAGLFIALGAVVLLVSTAGLYAITSHAVTIRTQEIGVRMAVGASAGDIGWMIGRRAIGLIVASSAIGVAATYASRDLMKTFVAQAGSSNWPLVATVAAVLGVVALVAAVIPARRATRMSPVAALRHD